MLSVQIQHHQEFPTEPEIARYAELLRQCSRTKNLAQGKRIHMQLRNKEFDQTTYLGNLTVQMYGTCGDLDTARHVFEGILNKNIFTWSILVAAYVENERCLEALEVFRWMQLEGMKPDHVTAISLLKACSSVKALSEAEKLKEAVPEPNVKLQNSLISLYVKCGSIETARALFDAMETRDVVSWNTMIGAYAHSGQLQEALVLLAGMEKQGLAADRITFASILSGVEKVDEGLKLHEKIVKLGLDVNSVGIPLIGMYGKCGRLEDAKEVFDNMLHRENTPVWNSMMSAYAQNGYTKKALDIFWRMDSQGVKMNEITFVTALGACSRSGFLQTGRNIHHQVGMTGFESHPSVAPALVNMYSKCGSLADGEKVFHRQWNKTSTSIPLWTTMLSSYVQHGRDEEAVQLFRKMDLEGLKPDHVTYSSVLGACSTSLVQARLFHERVRQVGYEHRVDVANALISMYGKCGSLEDAEGAFGRVKSWRSVVSWTSMITVYTRLDRAKEAIRLFKRMKKERVTPNVVTYAAVLGACSCCKDLELGKRVHDEVADKVDGNVVLGNSLIQMYTSCGSYSEARDVFEKMEFRNSVTWNLIACWAAKAGKVEEAVGYLRRMYFLGFCPSFSSMERVLAACDEGKLSERQSCVDMMMKTYVCTNVTNVRNVK